MVQTLNSLMCMACTDCVYPLVKAAALKNKTVQHLKSWQPIDTQLDLTGLYDMILLPASAIDFLDKFVLHSITGHPAVIPVDLLCSFLGEALRAVLVLEMRTLTVTDTNTCERVPAHLPQGCTALRATLRSCSGAQATVVLGGPKNGVCFCSSSGFSAVNH